MKVLITGGSRGIGKGIALELAKAGHDLLLLSKTEQNLASAKKLIEQEASANVATLVCDLSSKREIATLFERCQAASFAPEVLILNAGIFIEGDLLTSRDEDFEKTLFVNLSSSYYVVKQFMPLIENKTLKRIFLVGSTAGHEAYPVGALYGIAKWGLRGYAINLRKELITYGASVTLLSPGGTFTDLWEGEELPPDRLLDPTDIGKLVSCALSLSKQAVVEDIVVRPLLGDMHE